jgi:hypothetical protein
MSTKDVDQAEIIAACNDFHAGVTTETPDEALAHKYPRKLILAKMAKMAAQGVLECGVSLRTAWVAPFSRR